MADENAIQTNVMMNVPVFHMSDDWTMYSERLGMHFIANGVPDDKKSAVLLTSISSDVYKLLRGLCFPKKPTEETFAKLGELLSSHFKSQVCIFRERMSFYEAKQRSDESVTDWLSRLKQMAIHCGFGTILNNVLRDKFITGLAKGPMLDKGLEIEATETLEKCVATILKREASMKLQFDEIHKIAKPSGKPEKRTDRSNGKSQKSSDAKCFACGKGGHDFRKCKYRQYVCKVCSTKGHLAAMCKSKRDTVQYLEEDDERTIYSIDCGVENDFEIEATVNQRKLLFQIDTGSAVTCISENCYGANFNDIALKPCTQTLRGYANEAIKPVGSFRAAMTIGNRRATVNILVIRNGSRPLIGRDAMKEFHVNVLQINNLVENDVNQLVAKYQDLFSNELGRYTHMKVKLNLKDDQARPKFMKARTVPLAFKEQMDLELDRLVEKGQSIFPNGRHH